MNDQPELWGSCPVPRTGGEGARVTLAEGEGGRLARQFLRRRVLPELGLSAGSELADGARLPPLAGAPVLTCDAYMVTPLFFPGGDIGMLAVHGTCNDLAVCGARPRWLSLALMIEEGLDREVLARVLASARAAATAVGVEIVTGDTKVAPRGSVDQLFLATSGLGEAGTVAPPGPGSLEPGDLLLVSGPIARHGLAVLAAREQLDLSPPITSDAGDLWPAVDALFRAGIVPRAMRDATRGGVAAVLHEWAEACPHTLVIEQSRLPLGDDVRGACELLGLNPLHIACEGTMVLGLPAARVDEALETLRRVPICAGCAILGRVEPRSACPVEIESLFGRRLPLDEPTGMLLPRIC